MGKTVIECQEDLEKGHRHMSESPEVVVRGLQEKYRQVSWSLIDRERLELIALKGFEAVAELMVANTELDANKRFHKVERIGTELIQAIEREV